MPQVTHSQSTSFNNGKTFGPYQHKTYFYQNFIVSSALAVKTKVDADGWRPMTNWSKATSSDGRGSRVIMVYGLGIVELKYGGRIVVANENTPVLYTTLSGWASWPSEANVKNSALSKLKGQQLNIVMLLKDRRETLTGIHDRLKMLLASVRFARRGELVKSAQSLRRYWRTRTPGVVNKYKAANQKIGKPLASMWLELNFLHMQVVSDANGMLAEFSRDPQMGFVHGRSGLSIDKIESFTLGGYTWSFYGFMKVQVKRERIVYAQISAMPDMEHLTSASRLGLTNLPYILWDATPLSFVADWVLPVGSYLNGFDALLGMEFKGAHIGLVEKATVASASTEAPSGYSLSGAYDIKVTLPSSFERKLTNWVPDLPEFRNPLTGLAWKVATTAALLAGAVGSPQSKPR